MSSSTMRQNQTTQQANRAQVQVLFYNQSASANANNNNAQARLQQPFSANSVSDKRLQELRAFALEYVKQIVAKASELSQGRQEAKNAQKIALFYTGANINSAASKGEIREAAVQINKQFQLGANEPLVTRQLDASGARPLAPSAQVRQQQQHHHHVHINHSVQQLDELDQSSIGQPLEPGLSSSSTSSFANAASANSNKKAKKSPEQVNSSKEEKRKLYDRLNWHLLVSCFSTCLPQTMADSIPSGGSRAGAGGRGAAPL